MEKEKEKYITRSTLKEMGFSDKLREKYLANPCKLSNNPHHFSSLNKMKLWGMSRVNNTIQEHNLQPILQESLDKKAERKNAAANMLQKKEAEICKWVDELMLKIEMTDLPAFIRTNFESFDRYTNTETLIWIWGRTYLSLRDGAVALNYLNFLQHLWKQQDFDLEAEITQKWGKRLFRFGYFLAMEKMDSEVDVVFPNAMSVIREECRLYNERRWHK